MSKRVNLKCINLVALTLLAAASPQVLAQDSNRASAREARLAALSERFAELDYNGDGAVTRDEIIQTRQVKFDEFDQNGDGFIEISELPATISLPDGIRQRLDRRAARREENGAPARRRRLDGDGPTRLMFVARLDQDGDEKLSVEEFAAPIVTRFENTDLNGDGETTFEEVKSSLRERAKRRFERRGGRRRG